MKSNSEKLGNLQKSNLDQVNYSLEQGLATSEEGREYARQWNEEWSRLTQVFVVERTKPYPTNKEGFMTFIQLIQKSYE